MHSILELSSLPLILEYPPSPFHFMDSGVPIVGLDVNAFYSLLSEFVTAALSVRLKMPAVLSLAGEVRGTPEFPCQNICSVFVEALRPQELMWMGEFLICFCFLNIIEKKQNHLMVQKTNAV